MSNSITEAIEQLANDVQDVKPAAPPKASPEQIQWAIKRMEELGYDSRICPQMIPAMARWLVGEIKGWNHKGLILKGSVGTGKTHFFRIVLTRVYHSFIIHRAATLVELAVTCRDNGKFAEIAYGRYIGENLCTEATLAIDDLGEENTANIYGNKEEVLSRVICDRYDLYKRTGIKTFISTNLDMDGISARYGVRVSDRLREMCYMITIIGDSARSNNQ